MKRPSAAEFEAASNLAAQLRPILSRLKRRLREQGGGRADLAPSQISVLLRLEKDGPATVSSLARAEGVRPQSMSSIVTSLQDAGLVDSSSDPDDRRQTLMALSSKCQKLLREDRAARQDWLTTAILQEFSVREQQKLLTALELLGRLADHGPPS